MIIDRKYPVSEIISWCISLVPPIMTNYRDGDFELIVENYAWGIHTVRVFVYYKSKLVFGATRNVHCHHTIYEDGDWADQLFAIYLENR